MSINYVDPSTGSLTPIAGTPTKVTNSISNPNLLDNSWFMINQRGQSTYTAYGYTFDRWFNNSSSNYISVSEDTNGMHLVQTAASSNGFLYHRFENPLPPGIYTISANVISISGRFIIQCKYDDNTYSEYPNFTTTGITSKTINTNGKSIVSIFFQTYPELDTVIRAVKLEVGQVSTLANDVPPNYQQELAKCQRYFQRISYGSANIALALAISTTNFRSIVYLPCVMRTTPTLTYSGVRIVSVKGASTITPNNLQIQSLKYNSLCFMVDYSTGGLTAGDVWLVQLGDGGYIDLSADL